MGRKFRDIGIGACVMTTAIILMMFLNSWIKYEQDQYGRYIKQVELLRLEIRKVQPQVVYVTDVPPDGIMRQVEIGPAELIPKQNLPVTPKEK